MRAAVLLFVALALGGARAARVRDDPPVSAADLLGARPPEEIVGTAGGVCARASGPAALCRCHPVSTVRRSILSRPSACLWKTGGNRLRCPRCREERRCSWAGRAKMRRRSTECGRMKLRFASHIWKEKTMQDPRLKRIG